MDFEEQLEKAEKLALPLLVGSSLRSADDSAHQNYIHPEKYRGSSKTRPQKSSFLNSSIGASLDDLINEGALLGSEEDFERFLDDKGNVRSDAKYNGKNATAQPTDAAHHSALKNELLPEADDDAAVISPVDPTFQDVAERQPEGEGLYSADNYSAPNLSEYQLGHQIADHSELLDSVKSYDLNRLPSSDDREHSKTREYYPASERVPKNTRSTAARSNASFASNKLEFGDNVKVVENDSLHAPYFQRDARSPSRSRSAASEDRLSDRSRSRSRTAPHLARGDSYKNTHPDTPEKYELPADLDIDENDAEDDDRRTRQSRPTMGDSIAAAEAQEARKFHGESESITRDPSLVTTGDYTNFNADGPSKQLNENSMYLVRSESSTNYLRSISRSRSRQPQPINEKNDANPEELAKEGALVSDDPYDQVTDLDNLMKNVLKKGYHGPKPGVLPTKESKNLVNDVPAEEKDTETKEQLITEGAPTVTAKDIKVDLETQPKKFVPLQETEEDEEEAEEETHDLPAEEKIKEAKEQAIAEEAPTVTAADIKLPSDDAEDDLVSNEKLLADEPKGPETEKAEPSGDTESDKSTAKVLTEKPKDHETKMAELPDTVEDETEVVETTKPVEEEELATTKAPPLIAVEDVEAIAGDKPEEKEPETAAKDFTDGATLIQGKESVATGAEDETDKPAKAAEVTSAIENSAISSHARADAEDPVTITKQPGLSQQDPLITKKEDDEAATVDDEKVEEGEAVEKSAADEVEPKEVEHEDAVAPEVKDAPVDEATVDPAVKDVLDNVPEAYGKDAQVEAPAGGKVEDLENPVSEDLKEATAVEELKDAVKESPEEVKKEIPEEAKKEITEHAVTKPDDVAEREVEPATKVEKEAEPAVAAKDEDEEYDLSPEELTKYLQSLPVYLYTSLAGGMQIINKSNRLATILQANGIKFEYRDLGTDEEAKKLWRRYAQGKTLPGVVRGDDFIGNWEYIEEVNEDYRLKEVLHHTL